MNGCGGFSYFLNIFIFNVFLHGWMANAEPFQDIKLDTDKQAKCFSCMSEVYENTWDEIKDVYQQPKDFTNECNEEHINPTLVRTVLCPHVCVSIKEDVKVGDSIVKGYIRGCLNSVLVNGFNGTFINLYRWLTKDSCKNYQKRALFNLPMGLYDDTSYVNVCTCFNDFCNTGMGMHAFAHLKREKGAKGTLKAKNSANGAVYDLVLFATTSFFSVYAYF